MGDSPAIACSLAPEQVPARLTQAQELGRALIDVETSGSRAALRFESDAGTRAELDRFVSLESSCCPFFAFDVQVEPSATVLAIEAPAEGRDMLRGLVAGVVAAWELPK